MKKIILIAVITLITNNVYAIDNGYDGGQASGSGDYLTAAIMLISKTISQKKYPEIVVTDNTKFGKEKPFNFQSKE